jgi:hypothetical protein
MSKRYIHNPTAGVVFAGGVMIPPGEGREVDELFLPPEAGDAPEAAPAEPDLLANLRELLKTPVKELLLQLEALGTDTLDQLATLEGQAARPRSTLLAAIAELKLERAKRTAGGEGSEGGED